MPARRGDQGRFVEHPEVGLAKRLTERLQDLLYSDDKDSPVEERLDRQLMTASAMSQADPLEDSDGESIGPGAKVRLTEDAGGGVGVIVRLPGGGNVDVRRQNGSEVRVSASDTKVVLAPQAAGPGRGIDGPQDAGGHENPTPSSTTTGSVMTEEKAARLRGYWSSGEGAAKIGWGTDGAYERCVNLVSEHMPVDKAQGYCALRHKEVNGKYPGEKGMRVRATKGLFVGRDGERIQVKADLPDAEKGTMVALYPSDTVAQALEIPGGVPAQDLHVTLAYFPGGVDVDALQDEVEDFASISIDVPARVSGVARFQNPDTDDAFVVLVESEDLLALRDDLIDELQAAGFDPVDNHPWTPHITLTYLGEGEASPMERAGDISLLFGFMSVATGEDVVDFPLAADDEDPPREDDDDAGDETDTADAAGGDAAAGGAAADPAAAPAGDPDPT